MKKSLFDKTFSEDAGYDGHLYAVQNVTTTSTPLPKKAEFFFSPFSCTPQLTC